MSPEVREPRRMSYGVAHPGREKESRPCANDARLLRDG